MKNICTLSDVNYLLYGITLYESLLSTTENFVLHYLCLDSQTYNSLIRLECESLKLYNVDDFTDSDKSLQSLKDSEYKYFCWSLASYFTNYLLKSGVDDITYIDSDIYMYKSLDVIHSEIGNRDVGIFRHRQFPLDTIKDEGFYNVGLIYFKNSDLGNSVSDWWTDAVINKKYPHYATCGDQKYLDHFPKMCDKDSIYIDENIGHGAPWLWQLYEFLDGGKIKWGEKIQDLVFTHFSQFRITESGYIPSTMHHIYTPMHTYVQNTKLKKIYDDYYRQLMFNKNKYNL